MVEQLLKKLIEAETKILRAFFYYKTSSQDIAEDLYQDLMLRLIRSGQIKDAENPRAYLFRAAANLVKDHYRKSSTERAKFNHIQNDSDHNHDPLDSERILAARQKFAEVEAALAELPEQCRKIFRMVRIDGRRQKDVADALGVSLRTVENNLRKALLHCQERLRKKGME